MARDMPLGPWESFNVRVRHADLERIAAAAERAGQNRSEWARGVLLAALGDVPVQATAAPPVRAKGRPARLAGPDPEDQQAVIDDVTAREPDGTPRKARRQSRPRTGPPAPGLARGRDAPPTAPVRAWKEPESAADIAAFFGGGQR